MEVPREQKVVEVDIQGAEHLAPLLGRGDGVLITPNHPDRADPATFFETSHRVGRAFAYLAGFQLFHGSANCAGCHGKDAGGTDDGPPLTGAIWLHGPGTYQWLIEQIKREIPAHETWTGKPMPMRGWSTMPDEDVGAVAAYVWSITHPPRPPRSKPRPA